MPPKDTRGAKWRQVEEADDDDDDDEWEDEGEWQEGEEQECLVSGRKG